MMGKRLVYICDWLIAERGRSGPVLGLLLRVTRFWRRRIDAFEVLVGLDQARRLAESGIAKARIRLKRDPSPVAFTAGLVPLPLPEELRGGSGIILYSGNWGVAHDEHTFIEAYSEYFRQSSSGLRLWLKPTGSNVSFTRETFQSTDRVWFYSRTFRGFFSLRCAMPSSVMCCPRKFTPALSPEKEFCYVHLLASSALRSSRYYRVDVGDLDGLANALRAIEHALVSERKPVPQSDLRPNTDNMPAFASFATEHGQVQ